MQLDKYRFSVWVNYVGQSFNVVIESDSYYHAEMQAKAQYPTAYSIKYLGKN